MFSQIIPVPKPVLARAVIGDMIIAVLRGGKVTGSQIHISGSSHPSCTQANCFDLHTESTIQASGKSEFSLYSSRR